MNNATTTCTMQAEALSLSAKLTDLSDVLAACVQQDADSEDLLEALELTAEDLCDLSAKCYMTAQELLCCRGLCL